MRGNRTWHPPSETGGADATLQREEKRTETTVRIVTLQLLNRRRHNHKYVSFSTDVLSYSIHIRFFSQNQSLLSLIENQNITKRVERIKLNNADDDSLVTTQVEVEDKDGYDMQDKDDDKYVYVLIVILPYCI